MIIFFGNYTDENTYNSIVENGIRDLSQASRLFQEKLIENFYDETEQFVCASILPVNKRIVIPVSVRVGRTDLHYFTYNPHNFSSIRKCYRSVKSFIEAKNDGKLRIVSYAVNPILSAAIKKIKKGIALDCTTICSELPEFRRYKKSIFSSFKRAFLKHYNQKFDKYIVLTSAMIEYLPKSKKYYVLEGFAPKQVFEKEFPDRNVVMYAGGLAKDNGIEKIIEAAEQSNLVEEVWFFGTGELSEYLESQTNAKIKYFGRVSNRQIIESERKAKLLLNMRNPHEQLSKFSFPSKVLEYLSTGTLVVSTRLPGIPSYYFEYLIPVEFDSNDLARRMDEVLSLKKSEYLHISQRNLDFIQEKTAENRIEELIAFIKS